MSEIGSVVDAEIYRRHADPGSGDRRLPFGTCMAIWIGGSLLGWGALVALALPIFA